MYICISLEQNKVCFHWRENWGWCSFLNKKLEKFSSSKMIHHTFHLSKKSLEIKKMGASSSVPDQSSIHDFTVKVISIKCWKFWSRFMWYWVMYNFFAKCRIAKDKMLILACTEAKFCSLSMLLPNGCYFILSFSSSLHNIRMYSFICFIVPFFVYFVH